MNILNVSVSGYSTEHRLRINALLLNGKLVIKVDAAGVLARNGCKSLILVKWQKKVVNVFWFVANQKIAKLKATC